MEFDAWQMTLFLVLALLAGLILGGGITEEGLRSDADAAGYVRLLNHYYKVIPMQKDKECIEWTKS